MNDPAQANTETVANPPAKPQLMIKAFGIGSAGVNLLDQLARDGVVADSLIAVHSDAKALSACSAGEKVHFENKAPRAGNGKEDSDLSAIMAAEEQLPRLKSLCSGADIILIIAGLGGVLGTGLSAVVAAAAREAGAFVLAFVALPFDCEGSQRAQFADAGLKRLRDTADLVICWPNQKTLGLIDDATSLLDTFKVSNRLLGQCVLGAWRALGGETAIGLSFLELCRSIGCHSIECVFGIAEGTGPNRAPDALEHLLAHPMLNDPELFQQAPAVGVGVLGGPALAMAEVNRIMDEIHRRCEAGPVVMGATIIPELGESLLILVLLTRADQAIEPAESTKDDPATELAPRGSTNLGMQLLDNGAGERRHSRFVPPPPSLPPEKMAQLLKQQSRGPGRARKGQSKLRQTQLPLEIVSKGRFDKSEPTIHKGEDLDVPTYIRRGVALN